MLMFLGAKCRNMRGDNLSVAILCLSRGALRRISAKQSNARKLFSWDINMLGM